MDITSASAPVLPIMVKTWSGAGSHRIRYIRRSLPSLLASDLPPSARVIIVDDQSDDPKLRDLLQRVTTEDARVEVWRNPERMGPNLGQEYNVPLVAAKFPDWEFMTFCDDDIVYHPGWLQRTLQVAADAAAQGVTGVLSALNVPYRPAYGSVRLATSEVLLKERQAALNWVLPRSIYERVGPFKDVGIAFDTEYCDRMAALKVPVICLRPSWVQNIGYFGAYQSGTQYVAPDFVGNIGLPLSVARVYHTRKHEAREAASQLKQGLLSMVGLRPKS